LALVVLKPDFADKITPDELRSFLGKFVEDGSMSKWGVPDVIKIVDQIPKTSVGKINKKVIKQGVIDGNG